jgi:hypothetical protein
VEPKTSVTAEAPPAAAEDITAGIVPWPHDQPRADAGEFAHDAYDRPVLGRRLGLAGGLGTTVKALLALNLLLAAIMLGSDYLQYKLVIRLLAGADVPEAEFQSNKNRQLALGIVDLSLHIVTAIFFVIWFYRAHANLHPLGARRLTYTSGWAAGCWFVPLLNLFRPVQIAQEIWRNSDPNVGDGRDVDASTSQSSTLIGFWWAGWIIMGVINFVSARMWRGVDSPESFRAATIAGMFGEAATIIAALLALAVVIGIDARQMQRAKALRALATE